MVVESTNDELYLEYAVPITPDQLIRAMTSVSPEQVEYMNVGAVIQYAKDNHFPAIPVVNGPDGPQPLVKWGAGTPEGYKGRKLCSTKKGILSFVSRRPDCHFKGYCGQRFISVDIEGKKLTLPGLEKLAPTICGWINHAGSFMLSPSKGHDIRGVHIHFKAIEGLDHKLVKDEQVGDWPANSIEILAGSTIATLYRRFSASKLMLESAPDDLIELCRSLMPEVVPAGPASGDADDDGKPKSNAYLVKLCRGVCEDIEKAPPGKSHDLALKGVHRLLKHRVLRDSGPVRDMLVAAAERRNVSNPGIEGIIESCVSQHPEQDIEVDFNANCTSDGGKNRSNHNAIDREPVKTHDELLAEWLKDRLAAAGAIAKAFRMKPEQAKELIEAMAPYKKFHSNNSHSTAYADALLAHMPGLDLFAVPEDEAGKQVYMNWNGAAEEWELVEPKKLRDLVTLMVKLDRATAKGRTFNELARNAWAEFELGVSARSGTAVVDDIDRADSGMIIAADGQAISIDTEEADSLGRACPQRQDRPMRGRFAAACPDDDVDMKEWDDLLWVWMGGLFCRAEMSEEEIRAKEAEVRARIKWLAKVFGSALLPNADEQGFFFMLGRGQNGKSLFLRVMKAVFGDYAVGLDVENYIEKKYGGSEDRLSNRSLLGKRLAIFSDAGDSRAPMNVGRIKQLTGDGDIPMRGHHEHYFDAPVQVTLIGQGNYAPPPA